MYVGGQDSDFAVSGAAGAAGFSFSALGAGLPAGVGAPPLPEQPVMSSIEVQSMSRVAHLFFPIMVNPPFQLL